MATYYVRTDGSNANNGLTNSAGGAFLTIAFASANTTAGSIIRVQPGTYNEQATISASGSAGNYKNFLADGAVICRGFQITGASYVNITGFEITHNSQTAFNDGIFFSGTGSHVGIYFNYIHNIHATHGAITVGGVTPVYTDVTIRGNTITDTGYIAGVQFEFSSVAITTYGTTSEHWLIEYNTVQRCADNIYAFSLHHVIRNNAFTDYEDRSLPTVLHVDGFQSGSDQLPEGTHDQLYEANWVGNLRNTDTHVGLWQDTTLSGDTNIIFRGNVAYHVGGGGCGIISTKYFKAYNNTFDDISYLALSAGNFNYYGFRTVAPNTTDWPDHCAITNCILSSDKNFQALNYSQATNFRISNNVGYQVSTDASYVSTSNPLYVNSAVLDYRLQVTSPAKAAGTYQTTISSGNGSGTSFDVADATNFCDGYAIVRGDTITVNGTTVRITAISGNTITVNATVSWTTGMGVYWGSSATPDIGAYPYGTAEPTGIISNSGNNYTVTVSGDVRFVEFFENGISAALDYDAPYTYTSSGGTVTAKIYALYASATPVIPALPTISKPGIPGGIGRRPFF